MNEVKWWLHPQGIAAAATIAVMILGFFYVRERQLWEQAVKISSLEARGSAVVTRVDNTLIEHQKEYYELRDRVLEVEYKVRELEKSVEMDKKSN